MGCEILDSEISSAVKQLKDNKTPGPDGLSSEFFKKCWSIIAKEFWALIKEIYKSNTVSICRRAYFVN